MTLNPLAHVDPIGTLLIPAFSAISGFPLFGWGRPVHTQPTNYTRKYSMRAGEAMVAFAGPASNMILALLCAGLWAVLMRTGTITYGSPFFALLIQMVLLNFTLFILNLIPFPPLDGSRIAAWVFGYRADKALDTFASFGIIGLYAVLLLSGSFIGWFAGLAIHLLSALA